MHKGLNISAIWQLVKIIKNEQINIVHTHSSVDHRLAGIAARISGKPIVRSRHLSTPISRSPISKALYMKLADRVITSGESIRQAMIKNNRMSSDLIISIPAGIDIIRSLDILLFLIIAWRIDSPEVITRSASFIYRAFEIGLRLMGVLKWRLRTIGFPEMRAAIPARR